MWRKLVWYRLRCFLVRKRTLRKSSLGVIQSSFRLGSGDWICVFSQINGGCRLSVEVKLDVYEGPVGLLLSLIQAQSIDVYQISIAQLVQGYLAEIEARRSLDLEVATEFLIVAAMLLDIKCRKLFPRENLDDDEDMAFFEERDLLLARLLECKTYRDVSGVLSVMMANGSRRYPRIVGFGDDVKHLVRDPLTDITLDQLGTTFIKLLKQQAQKIVINDMHITPLPKMSIQVAREKILDRLSRGIGLTFDDICRGSTLRIDIVVYFLGLLELLRLGKITVEQESYKMPIRVALANG